MAIEMLFMFIYVVIVIVLGFYEHVQSEFHALMVQLFLTLCIQRPRFTMMFRMMQKKKKKKKIRIQQYRQISSVIADLQRSYYLRK